MSFFPSPLGVKTFGINTSLFKGRTLIVYFCAIPEQPPITGVAVTVAVTGTLLLFIAVNEGTLSVPDAGRPIDGFELVQLTIAPVVGTKLKRGNRPPSYTVVSDPMVVDGTAFIS